MKKAKLMLSTIAIFAVVASAFAFKANTYSTHFIFTGAQTQTGGATACTTRVDGAAISNGTANARASLTSLSTGCPEVFTVDIND